MICMSLFNNEGTLEGGSGKNLQVCTIQEKDLTQKFRARRIIMSLPRGQYVFALVAQPGRARVS